MSTAYIADLSKRADERTYAIQMDQDRYLAHLASGHQRLFDNDRQAVKDKELTDVIIDMLRESVDRNPEQIGRANEIFEAFGYDRLAIPTAGSVEDLAAKGYVKVRHYTSSSRAERIAQTKKFGGDAAPRPMDQGKVFVELASDKVLSPQEFIKRYAITNRDLGRAYVEFWVKPEDLSNQTCARNGLKEYIVSAKDVEDGKPVYRLEGDVEVYKR